MRLDGTSLLKPLLPVIATTTGRSTIVDVKNGEALRSEELLLHVQIISGLHCGAWMGEEKRGWEVSFRGLIA